jgi:uncharacterized ubiquitin-like protein YukD
MKITEFASKVCVAEGKKVEVNIAQVKEVLKVSNAILNGEFYKLIRKEELFKGEE